MKKILLTVFVSLSFLATSAQDSITDSLKNLLLRAKPDTIKINLLNDLSYELAETDTAFSCKYAVQALGLAKKLNYAKGQIKAYYNIAYFYEMRYQQPIAERYYKIGIGLATKNQLTRMAAIGEQDYAILLKKKGKFKEALQLNLKAMRHYEELKDSAYLATLYTNIGNCYSNLNLPGSAVAFHIRSLKLQQTRNNNLGITKAYNNIAIVYERSGNFEKALENYQRMLKPAIATGKKSLLAVAKGNIGSAYQNLKQPSKALPYVLAAVHEFDNLDDKPNLALHLNNLAAVYNDLGQYSKGYAASIRGLSTARQAEDTQSLAYAYITAASASAGLKNYAGAQTFIDSAYTSAQSQNFTPLLLTLYEQAGKIYKATGNYRKAQEASEHLIAVKDSTYNSEKHAQIAALQEQYESQRKDKLLAQNALADVKTQIEITRKNRLLAGLGSVLVALLLITSLIVRNMRLKSRKLEAEKALAASEAEQELLNEKLRISGELHDNIGSQLTFIHSSIQSLRGRPAADSQLMLKDTEEITVNTIRDLRQTVWFINNSTFSVDDFVIRLREYLKPALKKANVAVLNIHNNAPADLRLSSATATHLFRIVQEAINNSMKYADASRIDVELLQDADGRLTLSVQDDGRGFDVNESTAGFGLKNMKSRAQKSGGQMHIQSVAEKGTRVQVSVPV